MSERKTTVEHWNGLWSKQPRARVPSRLNIDVRNTTDLLRKYVRAGDQYLEIGCAPGKLLLWVANVLHAEVTGLDYASTGVQQTQALFEKVAARGKFFCEDIFESSLAPASFDVVFSSGLVEHFDDPKPIIQRHFDLVRPGGVALITVPNYSGAYRSMQSWLDPENLSLHNLSIMSPAAMISLAPTIDVASVRSFYWGKASPWILSLDKRFPIVAARLISLCANGLAQLQPISVDALSPTVVLEVRKGNSTVQLQ